MGVSGAEAVVAAASPWVGQGESACLVRPYVDCKHSSSHPHINTPLHLTNTVMTESELRKFATFIIAALPISFS